MRSHSRHKINRQGRGLQTRVLALGASLAIIVGGVLTYEGIHNSPKQVIHRLIIKDHKRAEKLAKAKPSPNTSTLVPWSPLEWTTHSRVADLAAMFDRV